MQASTHEWATGVVRRAWEREHGARPLSLAALQWIRGQGMHEGVYGLAGKPKGWAATKNWGAIQCPHAAPCGVGCLEVTDKHKDGTPYQACVKSYDSHEAAAQDLIHLVTTRRPAVWRLLDSGDYTAIAAALGSPGLDAHGKPIGAYFEDDPAHYAAAVLACAKQAAAALGEHLVQPGDPAPPPPPEERSIAGVVLLFTLGAFASWKIYQRTEEAKALAEFALQ